MMLQHNDWVLLASLACIMLGLSIVGSWPRALILSFLSSLIPTNCLQLVLSLASNRTADIKESALAAFNATRPPQHNLQTTSDQ